MQRLSLGTTEFEALRNAGQIYVDKTELIYRLAIRPEKFLLVRPPRFGKTLLISTLESLFKYGLRDFKSLAIEKLWKPGKVFKVLRLDFSIVKPTDSFEDFRRDFDRYLLERFKTIGFETSNRGGFIFLDIGNFLDRLEPSSFVLLIDNYDAPLARCLNDHELFNSVLHHISKFYDILKSCDRAIQFMLMTGRMDCIGENIFSGFNNLTDISLSPRFGSLLGFTREEIEDSFNHYLNSAAKDLSINKDELLELFLRQYGGYCFDETVQRKVCAPWPLLKFFDQASKSFKYSWPELEDGHSVLNECLERHVFRDPTEYGSEKYVPLNNLFCPPNSGRSAGMALLTQAGYLTIKKVGYGVALLDYPNMEAKEETAKFYLRQFLKDKELTQKDADAISKALSEGSQEILIKSLNDLFAFIDYSSYSVKDAASVCAVVQVYLASAGLDPKVKRDSEHCPIELNVCVQNQQWVMKFHVVQRKGIAAEILKEGLNTKPISSGREDLNKCAVLIYSVEDRKFMDFSEFNN